MHLSYRHHQIKRRSSYKRARKASKLREEENRRNYKPNSRQVETKNFKGNLNNSVNQTNHGRNFSKQNQ